MTDTKKDPNSANSLIKAAHVKHSSVDTPLDVTTTGGIQRTLAMHWAAIEALANKMDGIIPAPVVEKSPVVSPPVEMFYPVGSKAST